MGCYDTFIYNCPNCGKETSSQTKLGECVLRTLVIGSTFSCDGKYLMKNKCEHCSSENTVIIRDGRIKEFVKRSEAIFKEGNWGSCERFRNSEVHEQ